MSARSTLALVGVVSVLTAASPAASGQPWLLERFAAAETAIRQELATSGTPGAAVAVAVGDTVVWAKGFGVASVETNAAVTPDTLFQIGSVTKPVTAAAVLSAAADGALATDRPVSAYVSGLAPCVGQPTLEQLLSHTGGLIDEPDEFGPQGEDGLASYPRTWTREYCLLAPGREFSYSNSGFALAGLALQEVEKKAFADVVKARVLTPLGMVRTTFRPTEAMTWPLAVGHRRAAGGAFEVVRPLANDARLWPAGTLYSSANELVRFAAVLANEGRVEGRQVLPRDVVARMRRAVAERLTTDQRYGQGLFLDWWEGASHGGAMTGYVAHLTATAARQIPIAVVVLANGDGADVDAIERIARDAAFADEKGPFMTVRSRDGIVWPDRVLTEAQAEAFVGRYTNPRRFTVEVVRQGRSLVLRRFGRDFPMRPLAREDRVADRSGAFLVDLPRGGTESIVFGGLGADGHPDYLQMNLWALARVR